MGQGFGVADAAEGGEGAVVAAVAEAAGFVEEATFGTFCSVRLGDAFRKDLGFNFEAEDVGRDWGGGPGLFSGRVAWWDWASAISRARMRRRGLLRSMAVARSGARWLQAADEGGWEPWVSSSRVRRLRSSGSGGVAPSVAIR